MGLTRPLTSPGFGFHFCPARIFKSPGIRKFVERQMSRVNEHDLAGHPALLPGDQLGEELITVGIRNLGKK